jgi:hypothetical protein
MYTTNTVHNRLALVMFGIYAFVLSWYKGRYPGVEEISVKYLLPGGNSLFQIGVYCKMLASNRYECKQSLPWQQTLKPHFFYHGIQALVPHWQKFKYQWWLHEGLVCTISYIFANHLPFTYQPELSSWCHSVCYVSSRNSFVFWRYYIGLKVMVNVAKTLIC